MSGWHRVSAAMALLGRYRRVLGYSWQRRAELDGKGLRPQEAAFLPAALALQEQPVSSTARLTAWLLTLLVALLLLWSVLGKVDIIVNANGKIIPSQRVKTIASVDVASVRALHVVEGQQVKAGQLLVELDTSASDAEHDKAASQQGAAMLQVERARALIAAIEQGHTPQLPLPADGPARAQWQAEQLHLDGQYRDYQARLARIDGEIARCRQDLPLATQRANDYLVLLEQHDVARHAWLDKEQARIDLNGQLSDALHQRAALLADTRRAAYDQLSEGLKLEQAAHQDALRAGAHSQLLRLVAPVDGTVQQLNLHTVGGVVPAAQPLMEIVPASQALEVEAMLENRDVGFVLPGQRAEVKVEAFDYTKYGTVGASVTQVSRDAIADDKRGLLYAVKIMLQRPSIAAAGSAMPLAPGMAVSVEVKTGERRIIEYVLAPLLQHQREALHER
ncbi:HlyD family type I secretion periplasmic adaptor subunit [Duganella sp. FT135W]|uniref:Membrane fusion protein (MFP) family protein n=1 Tax=Duganella flavida TaxID=2692175 RepID=A0A6L8K8R8_9BURK|nr:HlyD family type I secretion periplasmic adaptor subunit [Duganella flavida]MYM22987.1 HlyD family type I secretion periplasmic adaptor subunit [Duganella flavida]